MSLRYFAEVTSKKCRKIFKNIKNGGNNRSSRRNFRSNKVLPEEIATNENNSNIEDFTRWSHLNASFIPTNSFESLATPELRVPPFPVHTRRAPSCYENVICQNNCDSAYFSDGFEFVDFENSENGRLCTSGVLADSGNSSSQVLCTENESFQNIWNETVESLVKLT